MTTTYHTANQNSVTLSYDTSSKSQARNVILASFEGPRMLSSTLTPTDDGVVVIEPHIKSFDTNPLLKNPVISKIINRGQENLTVEPSVVPGQIRLKSYGEDK